MIYFELLTVEKQRHPLAGADHPSRKFPLNKVYISACLFIIVLMLNAFTSFSQNTADIDPMPVKLKGQILSLEDESPVPNAIIMNMRTKATISADSQGRFVMEVLNIDSLQVSSLGFSKSIAHIPLSYNEMSVLIIYAKPVRFSIPEVNVKGTQKKVNMEGLPESKENKIAPELRGDAYNKKPPVIAAVASPASFLQYHLSKKEHEKRDARQAAVTEKNWETVSKYYNKELVMKITGLNNAQADNFMIYINSKGLVSQIKNDYDARTIIKEQFKLYTAEGH